LAFGPGAVFGEHQSFRTFPNLACGVEQSARGMVQRFPVFAGIWTD
jgi:hypothetical protein